VTVERRWRVGVALAVGYLALAFVTGGRPLFDGFAPPAPYRWVKPPPEFLDNQPPQAAERTIPVSEDGSEAANASTTDAQVIVTLPRGAVAARPPDAAMLLKIVPFDAASLAPLPNDLRAVSNAYQVSLSYQPSQAPVPAVSPAAIIALTGASASDGLHYLPPGARVWLPVVSRAFGSTHGQTGPFQGGGHYVVTASPQVANTTVPGPAPAGGSGGTLLVGVVLVATGVAGGVVMTARGRRQAAARRTRQRRREERRPKKTA